MGSVSVRFLDRDRVLAALRDLATRLAAVHPDVCEIRLFGSLARDDRNPYADADLLIVVSGSDLSPRDRVPVYKPTGAPVPIDLTVCTQAELDREVSAGNPFVLRILAESITLYARPATGSAAY